MPTIEHEEPARLTPKNWATEIKEIELQEKGAEARLIRESQEHIARLIILGGLLFALAFLVFITLIIIFLAGFHIGGFTLSDAVLTFLAGSTIAEIASLTAISLTWLYNRGKEKTA